MSEKDFPEYIPISIFDLFKIGIGPSSSHTMGPWRAALDFVSELNRKKLLGQVVGVKIELLGSLGKTGKGHATDLGVQMGLLGELPEEADPRVIPQQLSLIQEKKRISLATAEGPSREVEFDPKRDIVFVWKQEDSSYLDGDLLHPNTIFFAVVLTDGQVFQIGYHSVGGGFIERRDGKSFSMQDTRNFPYMINRPDDLMAYHLKTGLSFDQIVLANEMSWKSPEEIDDFLKKIKLAMLSSIYWGCHSEGVLPGGLKVSRRAPGIYRNIIQSLPEEIREMVPPYNQAGGEEVIDGWVKFIRASGQRSFHQVINWVTTFALAVNEENAAFGKIVTAPTNGAAGVIPAVMFYHLCFWETLPDFAEIKKFLLVAGEIGSLFKKGSTISAAAGGCQAEIGVSSAMAAAGLTAVKGGTLQQIFMAAEIAMEHHLGLTCDPIKGLVQVPCIERNTMGAIKAITSSQLALVSDPEKSVVQLQDVITTMWNTAQDMNTKYKETSEGGLAASVSVKYSEC